MSVETWVVIGVRKNADGVCAVGLALQATDEDEAENILERHVADREYCFLAVVGLTLVDGARLRAHMIRGINSDARYDVPCTVRDAFEEALMSAVFNRTMVQAGGYHEDSVP